MESPVFVAEEGLSQFTTVLTAFFPRHYSDDLSRPETTLPMIHQIQIRNLRRNGGMFISSNCLPSLSAEILELTQKGS
jgi:hypothetical protein